jgi:ribosomal protein S18 acetylase RimI-like enzyme
MGTLFIDRFETDKRKMMKEKTRMISEKDIPDKNLFMMCRSLNKYALYYLPKGYRLRLCRRDEWDLWKRMPFDDEKTAEEYAGYMTEFFNKVYGTKKDLFFKKCLFACDKNDTPVGTCFAWKAYDKITTIHWLKVLKEYEGQGIGRALLSAVMRNIPEDEYPVYLHTQPASFRAVKLYCDFGFAFLTDPVIGYRKNDLDECLPYLKHFMYQEAYQKLRFEKAPEDFLNAVKSSYVNEF